MICPPYQRDTIHFQFGVYIYITQPSIVSNYLHAMQGASTKGTPVLTIAWYAISMEEPSSYAESQSTYL